MMHILFRTLPAGLMLMSATAATADASFSLNGTAGLIDMPTAEVLPDGETAWTFTQTGTMSGGTMAFQLLPNLETAVHFTTVDEWLGGTLYDQNLDLKYKIMDESGYFPSLAIGFRDFLSNGAFSSEYIVATKNVGFGLAVTGGIGWGRLGSYNSIGTVFGPRAASISTGVDFNHFFRGDAAFFGGLEWDTPVDGLSLKAEYSSDAYVGEQIYGSFSPKSPFNFGVDYEPFEGISMGAYYNYGTDFGFRITLSGNANRPIVAPDLGTGPVPVNPRPQGYDRSIVWANNSAAQDAIVKGLIPLFEAEGVVIEEVRVTGNSIDLYVQNTKMPMTTKAVGRITRMLSVALPHSVEIFRITPVSSSLATTTIEIKRSDIEAQVERPNAGPDSFRTTQFSDAAYSLGDAAWKRDIYPDFSWSLNPRIPVSLSSGGSAASFDLLVNASAGYRISRGLSLNASLTQKVYGTINTGDGFSDSKGPSLDRLSADYLFKLNPSTYARVSAGYLDRKYGGIDAEVLWKPTNQNWGLGFELAAVQKRAPGSFLGFGDAQTFSAHASIYWDTGFHGLEAQVDVGRYLAGDLGSTVMLSRRFANGWEVAGFVTVTDMPFADFGEGNFSKGISVTIPLRWTMPLETRSSTSISLGTSGNGGQRVGVGNRLYPIIRDYDVLDLRETWGAYWQ